MVESTDSPENGLADLLKDGAKTSEDLAARAGLGVERVIPTQSQFSIVEGRPV